MGKATEKKVPAYVVSVCTIEMRSDSVFWGTFDLMLYIQFAQ